MGTRRTWILLAAAVVAVSVSVFPLFKYFLRSLELPVVTTLIAVDAPYVLRTGTPIPLGVPDEDGVVLDLGYAEGDDVLYARGPCGDAARCPHVRLPPPDLTATMPDGQDLRQTLVVERLSRGLYVIDAGRPAVDERKLPPAKFARATFAPDHRTWIEPRLALRGTTLPVAVGAVAVLALVVAFLRARLAIAYARTLHRWTEARVNANGMVEDDEHRPLGVVAAPGLAGRAILLSSDALSGDAEAYRGTRVIAARHVVRGTHAQWRTATAMRLRDARALAVLATLASGLAFVARFALA